MVLNPLGTSDCSHLLLHIIPRLLRQKPNGKTLFQLLALLVRHLVLLQARSPSWWLLRHLPYPISLKFHRWLGSVHNGWWIIYPTFTLSYFLLIFFLDISLTLLFLPCLFLPSWSPRAISCWYPAWAASFDLNIDLYADCGRMALLCRLIEDCLNGVCGRSHLNCMKF